MTFGDDVFYLDMNAKVLMLPSDDYGGDVRLFSSGLVDGAAQALRVRRKSVHHSWD